VRKHELAFIRLFGPLVSLIAPQPLSDMFMLQVD